MKTNLNKTGCPPLGAHTSIAGGLFKAPERGKHIGADVVQIFSKNQRQWKAPPLHEHDAALFLQKIKETGVSVPCIHTSYLINIAAPVREIYQKSIVALREEVHRAALLEVPYLVLHPGSFVEGNRAQGIRRVVNALEAVLPYPGSSSPHILLETTAGQGTQLGCTLEELAEIIERTTAKDYLGVCVDTCHVFAAGYSIHTAEGWKAFKYRLEETVQLQRVRIIHLNDSRMPFGSYRDRHARIGEGYIGLAAFRRIVTDPDFTHVPQILEIPGGESAYAEDLRKLRDLCNASNSDDVERE